MTENNEQISPSEMELENSNTSNLGTPRRSSRKMKPTTSDSRFKYNDNKLKRKLSTHPSFSCNKKNVKTSSKFDKMKKKNNTIMGKGVYCSVKNCRNRYSNSKVLSFFGYPRNKEIQEIWIKNCKIQHLVNPHKKISINLRVCGNHFEDCMFLNVNKRNRLVPNAVPTLFYDNDKSSTSQSMKSETELTDIEKTSVDTESETKNQSTLNMTTMYIVDPSSVNKTQLYKSNIPNINLNCSVSGCTSSYDNGIIKSPRKPKSVALFIPPQNIINNWSSILEVELTEHSVVCEKHFKSEDIITRQMFFHDKGLREIKSLKAGAMPVVIKKYPNATKRSKNNDESLIVKKVKTDIKDHSNNIQVDLHDDSTLMSTLKSSTDSNNIVQSDIQLSKTLINSSASTSNSSQPNFKINDQISIDLPSMNLTVNSESNSSQSSFEEVLPKILANSSLSITLQKNVNQKKHSSEMEPIKIVDSTDILKQTSNLNTESTSILQTTSNNSSVPSQSNIEKILSKTLNNNCLSITRQSSKQVEPIPAVDSSRIMGIKSINSLPNISIVDSMSNTLQSNIKEPSKTHPVSITPQLSIQQSKQLSAIDSTEVVDLTDLPNIIDIKNEPIDIISNDDSLGYTIPENDEQVLSTNSNNNSLSMTTSFNHNIPTASIVNNSMTNTLKSSFKSNESSITKDIIKLPSNTLICPEYVNNQFFPMANNVSQTYKSTDNDTPVIFKCYSLNPNINHSKDNNNVHNGTIGNKEDLAKINASIRDMCKEVVLPNLFWKSLYNMNTNKTAFIQRNEFMETIKKIYFQNSLVPNIYIKSKRYEFNEAIKTKNELENLLEKIDSIEICLGDDGYYNDQCIGYFSDTSEETELCRNCEDLVKDENLYTMDAIIKDKNNKIKQLKNKISELEIRVLQARKKVQKNKNKMVLRNLLEAINPSEFLSALKPPEY